MQVFSFYCFLQNSRSASKAKENGREEQKESSEATEAQTTDNSESECTNTCTQLICIAQDA